MALAGCGGSSCPAIQTDGGVPTGACAGAAMCTMESTVAVGGCSHDVQLDCACANGAWRCDAHTLDHHACPLRDGGFD